MDYKLTEDEQQAVKILIDRHMITSESDAAALVFEASDTLHFRPSIKRYNETVAEALVRIVKTEMLSYTE